MPYSVNLKHLQSNEARKAHADTGGYYFWEEAPQATPRAAQGKRELMLLSVLFIATLAAALFVGTWYLRPLPPRDASDELAARAAASVRMAKEALPAIGDTAPQEEVFRNLSVVARGAVVYDASRAQIAFARDARRPLPLASLTKIMTALAAMDILGEDAPVTVTPYALATEGDNGLAQGEVWRGSDLAAYMLITSSNDAAVALAQAAGTRLLQNEQGGEVAAAASPAEAVVSFVTHMNRLAQAWGLEDMRFRNPTGLDLPEGKPGAVGSARDAALLFLRLMRAQPELARATREKQVSFVTQGRTEHVARNTNRRVQVLPGLLAGKTGYTDLAGGNLAIVADLGMGEPVAIVVLGSSFEERFTDVEQLLEAAFLYRGTFR